MNKKAFTLVENMIIVAIIALVIIIALPNVKRVKMSSNEAATRELLDQFGTALEQYAIINKDYPADLSLLTESSPPYFNQNICDGNVRNGYVFKIIGGAPLAGTYFITATPVSCGNSGQKIFYLRTNKQMTEDECDS